jgi:SAM-dependent methyltransferase
MAPMTERRAPRYADVIDGLRLAYDRGAAQRDGFDKEHWKLVERAGFLARVRAHGGATPAGIRLLEVGAGTGQDSVFFAESGLDVVATDLSPEMVARCRAKGVDARVMDVLQLDLPPGSFDAVYSMNCLLHVPSADLPAVLRAIRGVLRPGGLCYLGSYGGAGDEGVWPQDWHDPPRFFSWRTDEQIQEYARESFAIVDFHVVVEADHHFQSLTLSA